MNWESPEQLVRRRSVDKRGPKSYRGWATEFLGNGAGWDDKWTKSTVFGSKEFVEKVKTRLGILAKGSKATVTDTGFQLRDRVKSLYARF